MGSGKFGATDMHLHTIASIAFGTTLNLFGNHIIGGFHHFWKREPARLAYRTKHGHGVVLHHTANRLAQCLRGNGAQMGAATTRHSTLVDNRYPPALLNRVHRSAFTGRTTANYH